MDTSSNDTTSTTSTAAEVTHRLVWSVDVEDLGAGTVCDVAMVTLHETWFGAWMIIGHRRFIVEYDDNPADPETRKRFEDSLLEGHHVARSNVEVILPSPPHRAF